MFFIVFPHVFVDEEADKFGIIKVLKEAVQNGENREIQTKHIEKVRDMLGKDKIFE